MARQPRQNRIETIAGDGGGGTGNFYEDGGPATEAAFGSILGIAPDDEGNLYLADNWSRRVRRIS